MKKNILITTCMLLMLNSCQEVPEQNEYPMTSIDDINVITKELVKFTASNLSKHLSIGKNGEVWYDNCSLKPIPSH